MKKLQTQSKTLRHVFPHFLLAIRRLADQGHANRTALQSGIRTVAKSRARIYDPYPPLGPATAHLTGAKLYAPCKVAPFMNY